MPLIRLTTRDAQELSFDCSIEQNLVEAAAAANIILPAQCRQGSCGACYATVIAGDYTMGEHNPDALPASNSNGILMCRTMPRSDLEITLPYNHARILFHAPKCRSAEIKALETVAQNTIRLELQLDPNNDSGSAAEFEPGQFMQLEIPGSTEHRAYSLANTPNWDGRLEFFIRLRSGPFSTFLAEVAKPGMKLTVHGPLGAFGVAEGSLRPRWFVTGGTGLAPMLSMLRRMAEFQEMQEVRLFFGVNQECELFALNELRRLGSELPQLRVVLCVWQPEGDLPTDANPNWLYVKGTPIDALKQAFASSTVQPDLYVCGPAPLVDATFKMANEAGLPPDQIFSERF